MPHISNSILEVVIYLYPSKQAALDGAQIGGTGFLCMIEADWPKNVWYLYAVTTAHCLPYSEGESLFARMNLTEGGFEVIELPRTQWHNHPDGDDVVVCELRILMDDIRAGSRKFQITAIPAAHFISHEVITEYRIGPGDDVFMPGRFIDHEGKQKNLPSVRFGHISMMPWEPIKHTSGKMQESFLVEMLSRSGYSGSPVFVIVAPYWKRSDASSSFTPASQLGPWLLGIVWGHIPHYLPVLEKDRVNAVQEQYVVPSHSGASCVVPAWKLMELLQSEELLEIRERYIKENFPDSVKPQGADIPDVSSSEPT